MMQLARVSGLQAHDRRGYVRIHDAVGLHVRKIVAKGVEGLRAVDEPVKHTSEAQNGQEITKFANLEELRLTHPGAASHIEALELKLKLVNSALVVNSQVRPTHKVNLSGSGIAFGHDELLQPGDQIQLQLTLFPEMQKIAAIATVVSVGESVGTVLGGRYAARAIFSNISSEDRAVLVEHINQLFRSM